MQIKQAAAQCGLTEKAIRLYEEKGLITPTYTERTGGSFAITTRKPLHDCKQSPFCANRSSP